MNRQLSETGPVMAEGSVSVYGKVITRGNSKDYSKRIDLNGYGPEDEEAILADVRDAIRELRQAQIAAAKQRHAEALETAAWHERDLKKLVT